MPEILRIEVAWALPQRQRLVALELPAGSTVADAIAASGLRDELPAVLDTGIHGKRCPPEERLRDGCRCCSSIVRTSQGRSRRARSGGKCRCAPARR